MSSLRAFGGEWREAGEEPALAQVLDDPIVRMVMRRDGVEIADLKAVIARAQAALMRMPS